MKQWGIAAIIAVITIFLSVVIAVGIIRACVASDPSVWLSIASMVCGNNLNASHVGFKRIMAENITSITSGITESKEFSIDRDNDATKLMDGKKTTLAAPANQKLEYIVALTEPYRIRQTIITWGDYGVNSNYITHWVLEASVDGAAWTVVKTGGSPRANETIVNENFTAMALRIKAQSPKDWIGIYELQLIGRPL